MSYIDTSCQPPSGSTYLTIGQDLFSIQEYVTEQYNMSLHSKRVDPVSSFAPSAAMFYTDIQTLRGLKDPVDYGSGVEYADGITDSLFQYQNVGLQIGLWLNGTRGCKDMLSGLLDKNIENLIDYLSNTKASKVFLRVGYEFDNPSFGFSDDPPAFRKAFIYLVRRCRLYSKCYDKVKFVWHSWAAKRDAPLEDFYPGDDFVDWVGVSIFDQFFPWSQRDATRSDITEVLEFANIHNKPSMIAESTPFGGIDLEPTITKSYEGMDDAWNRWFQPVLDLIDEYDIGMWSYINCAWQDQPMWHNVGFGETRLSTNTKVMQKWHDKVFHGHRSFLLAGSLLNCGESEKLGQALKMSSQKRVKYNNSKDGESAIGLSFFIICILLLYIRRRTKSGYQEIKEEEERLHFLSLLKSSSPKKVYANENTDIQ